MEVRRLSEKITKSFRGETSLSYSASVVLQLKYEGFYGNNGAIMPQTRHRTTPGEKTVRRSDYGSFFFLFVERDM